MFLEETKFEKKVLQENTLLKVFEQYKRAKMQKAQKIQKVQMPLCVNVNGVNLRLNDAKKAHKEPRKVKPKKYRKLLQTRRITL